MNSIPVLEVKNLSKRFGDRGAAGLKNISFSISDGETLAAVGASGSGKTTLARLIMRLAESDEGSIRLQGQDITVLHSELLRPLRPRFQMVFQDPLAAFNPRASVRRILEDPLRLHGLAAKEEYDAVIGATLERVGLSADLMARFPLELSGGQRQRVAIARAILTKPALIVLDEPVSALDVSVRAQILNLLLDLQEETGVAYLFISHDLAVVRAFADRMIVLEEGRIVESGITDEVLANPLADATRVLIDAVPRLSA
ncbi:ABC transporter ATP-binding protein [Phyllobacterium zundukense]|uniref:Peptide ABC transporter ATP-binding protein n=1 Tax=Phyllobacterium zundukense TaxID=1867719 RepID=A0A2N9VR60_9HYPH|nr:ATP-binding cassette domain-containing protein [Phyllobacterium zundukense]ATU92410.1 peptide ABC transporter ATP-binding protein [Phyllobacterium zundukense]PIO41978.1 peptide ABC transporter ATP-binding protein [Phyllobacterium zundukense]